VSVYCERRTLEWRCSDQLGLFGKPKKMTYRLCLIAYKLKDPFGNNFSKRAYSMFLSVKFLKRIKFILLISEKII
jgi:hypothetical protein